MKKITKQSKAIAIGVGVVTLVIVMLILLFNASGSSLLQNGNSVEKIQATNADGTLIVGRDGNVQYRKGDTIYTDYWNSDRTNAFFDYYDETYAQSASIDGPTASFSYDDDELLDVITDQTENGNTGGNTGDDNEDISEYFNTPRPSNTPSGTFIATPTPNPQGQPWCLYWRLSYCVILYTPPPAGTPNPNEEEGILPPECNENLLTGKTVIGQELCVPSPSPTPQ